MDQKINVITLGVEDVPRAREFYERLGWTVTFTDGDIVMFQAGPMIVSLWDRGKLAADSGVTSPGAGGAASPSGTPSRTRTRSTRSAAARPRPARPSPARRRTRGSATPASSPTPTGTPGRSPGSRRSSGTTTAPWRCRHEHDWDQLRAFCLSLPDAQETFSFGPGCSVFKAPNGRMFGVSVTAAEPLDLSVKCDPERGRSAAGPVRRRGRGLPPRQAALDHGDAQRRRPGRAGARARRGQLRPGRQQTPGPDDADREYP